MNLLPRIVHLVCVADGLHRVTRVAVGADAVGVFLIEDRTADYDFAPRRFFLEQFVGFLHGRDGGGH